MAGLTITCPTCGQAFPVPSEVLGVDTETNHVIVRLDRAEMYGHLTECVKRRAVEVADPVDGMLDGRGYVARGGSRACVMCGATGEACMSGIRGSAPCCPPCRDGNTHPAPGESQGCREWATLHGGTR